MGTSNASQIANVALHADKEEEFLKDMHEKKYEPKDSQKAKPCDKVTDALNSRGAFEAPKALRKKSAKDIYAYLER